MTQSEAPPMIAFCGAPFTSSQYGISETAHWNLASRRTLAWPPVLSVSIAHSPLENLAPPSLVRPAYWKAPFFARSASIWSSRTCSASLIVNCVSRPAIPFSFVPMGMLCHAAKFSTWTHEGHDVVYAHFWPEAWSLSTSARNSFQVFGGVFGSSPAFLNASLF